MKTHYIVLNGKRYDATTGALIDLATPSISKLPAEAKPTTNITPLIQKHASKKSEPTDLLPHKPQSSITLTKKALKPETSKNLAAIKKQYPISKTNSKKSLISKKTSINSINYTRLKRAASTPKSTIIGHFSAHPISPIRPQILPVQVVQSPMQDTSRHIQQSQNTDFFKKKQNIFEDALAKAKSHENMYIKPKSKKSSKKYSVASAVVALIACTTLLGLSFRQNIETKIASIRTGFAVTSPTFVPSGFIQQTTAVQGKSVSINYVSPQDRTTYSLTQESSGWNSSSLLASVAAKSGNSYRVILNNGKTIFLYNHNKAEWVEGGVLYTIAGNAPLTTDQITSIASSLD